MTNNYEITKSTRTICGKTIHTTKTDIHGANILSVEVGTNGHQGGDSGHGSRTFIRIADAGGTDIDITSRCNPFSDDDTMVEITLGGDSELDTMIEALEYIVDELKKGKMQYSCREYLKSKSIHDDVKDIEVRKTEALESIAESLKSNMGSPSFGTTLDEIAMCIREGRCKTDISTLTKVCATAVDNIQDIADSI